MTPIFFYGCLVLFQTHFCEKTCIFFSLTGTSHRVLHLVSGFSPVPLRHHGVSIFSIGPRGDQRPCHGRDLFRHHKPTQHEDTYVPDSPFSPPSSRPRASGRLWDTIPSATLTEPGPGALGGITWGNDFRLWGSVI